MIRPAELPADEAKVIKHDETGKLLAMKQVLGDGYREDGDFKLAMIDKISSIVYGREFFWSNYVLEAFRGKIPSTDLINMWTRVMLGEKEYFVSYNAATKQYALKRLAIDPVTGIQKEEAVTFTADDKAMTADGVTYMILRESDILAKLG